MEKVIFMERVFNYKFILNIDDINILKKIHLLLLNNLEKIFRVSCKKSLLKKAIDDCFNDFLTINNFEKEYQCSFENYIDY